jgi:acetyl esterase
MEEYHLEPVIQRLLKLGNRFAAPDPTMSWPRKRLAGSGLMRHLSILALPNGPAMLEERLDDYPSAVGRNPVKIFRPRSGRLPVHLFFHGGGFCLGGFEDRAQRCREIAARADCVVISVAYRFAPENAFPAAPEDCYAALCWAAEQGERLDLDTSRISVGGESAGANLAAVVALLTRDRGGPPLCFQWLDVPATDLTQSQPAAQHTPDGFGLDKAERDAFMAAYLQHPGDALNPYASPLLATDHSDLPPALVMSCSADPLRDDAQAYAEKLRAAGVPVTEERLEGHVHVSFGMTRLASARAYEDRAIALLREAFATP